MYYFYSRIYDNEFMDKMLKLITDRLLYSLITCSTVLLGFHIFQFIDSGFMIEPLIRVAFYALEIPILIIFKEASLPYLLLAFGLILTLQISFDNFTPFILIITATLIKNKTKFSILSCSLYLICVVIVCTMHHKTSIHLAIHILGCIYLFLLGCLIFVTGENYFNKTHKSIIEHRDLKLTETERAILEGWARTHNKSKIEGYSRSTVIRHLKKAAAENGLNTPDELLAQYEQKKDTL